MHGGGRTHTRGDGTHVGTEGGLSSNSRSPPGQKWEYSRGYGDDGEMMNSGCILGRLCPSKCVQAPGTVSQEAEE